MKTAFTQKHLFERKWIESVFYFFFSKIQPVAVKLFRQNGINQLYLIQAN